MARKRKTEQVPEEMRILQNITRIIVNTPVTYQDFNAVQEMLVFLNALMENVGAASDQAK